MRVRAVAPHRAREDAQITHAANERIDNGLEDLRRERIFRMAFLDVAALGVKADGHVEIRRRHIFDNAVHKLLDADVLLSRAAEYGEDFAGLNAFNHGCRNLDFGDFLPFDVFLQQFIVEFSHGLNEFLTCLFDIALNVLWNIRNEVFLIMRDNLHMQGQQVDDALKGRFLTDWQLHGHDTVAEAHAQLFDDLLEIRMLAVHLIDKERARQLRLFRIAPGLFRFHLDARRRRNHDECAVRRRQRPFDFTDKVRISRSVDEIDFIITPFAGRQLHVDGQAALFFFRLTVKYARVFFNAAEALDRARIEKTRIEKTRLARLAMAKDRYVAQVRTLIRFHRNPS